MKKLLSLVLALVLALGMFAMTASAEAEPIVIDWLGGHDTDPISEGDTVLAWLEEKFNVKLNVWFIERNNAAELLATRWAADEVPDVFWLEKTELFVKAVNQGVCLEFPIEQVKELLPNSYQWLMEFDPDCFDMVSIAGTNYGLPRVNLDAKFPYAPFWRADWLEKAGYERGTVPRTIEEFEEVFYFFANEDPDGNGVKDTYAISNTGFLPIFGAFGALPDRWIVNEEGNLEYGAVYAGMKDALELLAKWYADGLVDPEFVTGENQGGHWSLSIPFENGTLGFSSSGAFYQLEPDFDGPKNEETGEGGSFQLGKTMRNLSFPYEDVAIGYNPIGPDGKNGGVQWTLTTAEAVCFSYKLKDDPDKLAKICEIIDTIGSDYDTWVRVWNWDLNDDAYEYDDLFGFVKKDPEYTRADDNTHTNMFNTLQNPYFKMTADPARYNWVNSLDQFKQHGYTDQLKTVTASNPTYWTALESYRAGTYVQFIRGEKPLDEWDDFVAQWYSMGGEIITEEANEWYHAK